MFLFFLNWPIGSHFTHSGFLRQTPFLRSSKWTAVVNLNVGTTASLVQWRQSAALPVVSKGFQSLPSPRKQISAVLYFQRGFFLSAQLPHLTPGYTFDTFWSDEKWTSMISHASLSFKHLIRWPATHRTALCENFSGFVHNYYYGWQQNLFFLALLKVISI